MSVAVMGCVVNGPGESKHANIGISLPGSGEAPVAPVFIDGQKRSVTLKRRAHRARSSRRSSTNYVRRDLRELRAAHCRRGLNDDRAS